MRTIAAVVLVAISLAACGGGNAAEPGAAQDEDAVTMVEIVARDFSFELDQTEVPAGTVGTTLINEGKAPHQAGYYLLDEGVTFEEFFKEILADDDMIPQLSSGGRAGHMRSVRPNDTGVRPGDRLEPGSYAVLCSIRDPETGKNHYELGMVATLTVN